MHRLRGTRCYLAGAMDRVPDGGVVWRQRITPELNDMGIVVMDPCNKPYFGAVENDQQRAERRAWKEAGELRKCGKAMKAIRTMDLRMVDVSDFIVASIDVSVHMCGSYEEISLANRQKKPVLCWVQQGITSTPDWLLGMLPPEFFFSTMEELMCYLHRVDSSPRISHMKRWYLPKYDMLYNPLVLEAFNK